MREKDSNIKKKNYSLQIDLTREVPYDTRDLIMETFNQESQPHSPRFHKGFEYVIFKVLFTTFLWKNLNYCFCFSMES